MVCMRDFPFCAASIRYDGTSRNMVGNGDENLLGMWESDRVFPWLQTVPSLHSSAWMETRECVRDRKAG